MKVTMKIFYMYVYIYIFLWQILGTKLKPKSEKGKKNN